MTWALRPRKGDYRGMYLPNVKVWKGARCPKCSLILSDQFGQVAPESETKNYTPNNGGRHFGHHSNRCAAS